MEPVCNLHIVDWANDHLQIAWPMSSQSASGQAAEPAIGHAAHGQSVMGVPSDISHVLHPDGRSTPAMFVEVTADCKVSITCGTTPIGTASCTAPS